jgi:hypothetical protein
VTAKLESFYRDENREYLRFVDGGITENLGLRAIYEIVELSGGANNMIQAERELLRLNPKFQRLFSDLEM